MHSLTSGSAETDRFGLIIAQATQLDCQMVTAAIERQCRTRVLACVVTSSEAARSVEALRPDLLLINAKLQDGPYAGLKLAKELYRSPGHPKTVLMLDADDRELVVECFRCGANGIFTRAESASRLRKCVTAVLNGQVWVNNTHVRWMIDALAETPMPDRINPLGIRSLTKREEEVRRLMAAGLNNRQIANRLHIHENTVKSYASGIFEKLGISSRLELILHFFAENPQASSPKIGSRSERVEKFGT